MNMGPLVPIGIQEVLPGDTLQQSTSALIRVSPLLAPIMHPVQARVHHWFVPFRLIWDDFEDFITGGPDGMDASVFPTMTTTAVTGAAVGSIEDYIGVPTGVGSLEYSALPLRAYNMIWNEWYRDQDLQTEAVIDTASGPDTTTERILKAVGWEKDYFTTARPWAQKGPDVNIPFAEFTAPITGVGKRSTTWGSGAKSSYETDDTTATSYASGMQAGTGTDDGFYFEEDPNNPGRPNIRANLADVAGSINSLREAFAIQRYEEARARYGSRYTEYLRYLGVKSSDARLQRPEYLGGGKQSIQFSEVLQTSNTTDGDDTEGVGNMKGHGIGAMRSNRYRRFFEEHGYVMTFLSVKPKTVYTQGLSRHFNRRTKEDFFQKELQHIGQQEILNKELYAAAASPNGTFGYQDRYDEYRRAESSVSGEFRSTLDFWHMARIFASEPTLNGSFIASVPTDRVYASTTTDQLYVMANHSIQARRMVAPSGGNSYVY